MPVGKAHEKRSRYFRVLSMHSNAIVSTALAQGLSVGLVLLESHGEAGMDSQWQFAIQDDQHAIELARQLMELAATLERRVKNTAAEERLRTVSEISA